MRPYLKKVDMTSVKALTDDGIVYDAQKNIRIVTKSEEEYFAFYNHLYGYLHGCKNVAEFKFLNWLGEKLKFNDPVIVLNKFFKQEAMSKLDLSLSAIHKAIKNFVVVGILIPNYDCKKCAVYYVNPTFLWKGYSTKREQEIKTVLTLQHSNTLPEREKIIIDDINRYVEFHNSKKSIEDFLNNITQEIHT